MQDVPAEQAGQSNPVLHCKNQEELERVKMTLLMDPSW
jgi:hypothetical protein